MATDVEAALLSTLQSMTDRLDRMERRLAGLEQGQRHIMAVAQRESVSVTRQGQALAALVHRLDLPPDWLPPVRGMAASPDFLLALVDATTELAAEATAPLQIVEVGSGLTTLILARTLDRIGSGTLHSLEHREEDIDRTGKLLAERGLTTRVRLIHAPLTPGWAGPQRSGLYYDRAAIPEGPFDLAVIDGPPAWEDPLARYPAGEALIDRLADGGLAVMDDADRKGERECVRLWQRSRPDLIAEPVPLEKGMIRLRRSGESAPA